MTSDPSAMCPTVSLCRSHGPDATLHASLRQRLQQQQQQQHPHPLLQDHSMLHQHVHHVHRQNDVIESHLHVVELLHIANQVGHGVETEDTAITSQCRVVCE